MRTFVAPTRTVSNTGRKPIARTLSTTVSPDRPVTPNRPDASDVAPFPDCPSTPICTPASGRCVPCVTVVPSTTPLCACSRDGIASDSTAVAKTRAVLPRFIACRTDVLRCLVCRGEMRATIPGPTGGRNRQYRCGGPANRLLAWRAHALHVGRMKPTLRLFVVGASIAGCAVFRPSTAAGPGDAHTPLARSIDSMIGARDFRSANWGILIVDPERRETLYTHNATKLFIPASNQKLVVSSVLLERMGPDYHFRTILAARGTIADGTLNGDLAVIGRGDPTASNHMKGDAMLPLRAIADSLWQRGVRRITGDVVAAGDACPGPVAGSGWPWDQLDATSFAGVDELLFNEGLQTVRVRPGARIGDPAVVETRPARMFPILQTSVTTVARDTTAGAAGG